MGTCLVKLYCRNRITKANTARKSEAGGHGQSPWMKFVEYGSINKAMKREKNRTPKMKKKK
jgi:hypothetical protein